MSAHFEPVLTVADLDLMPDDGKRYELIEGEIFVSRAPGLSHQTLLKNLIWFVDGYLRSNPIGILWPTPGVILDEFNAVIPDLIFVRNERIDEVASTEKITGAPDLVIEIMSPGAENSRRDRVLKLQIYQRFGVSEYWVVDGYQRSIEVYRLVEGKLERITTVSNGDELTSASLPGFSCQAWQIFGHR
jgi:Uma2 family endonuclease